MNGDAVHVRNLCWTDEFCLDMPVAICLCRSLKVRKKECSTKPLWESSGESDGVLCFGRIVELKADTISKLRVRFLFLAFSTLGTFDLMGSDLNSSSGSLFPNRFGPIGLFKSNLFGPNDQVRLVQARNIYLTNWIGHPSHPEPPPPTPIVFFLTTPLLRTQSHTYKPSSESLRSWSGQTCKTDVFSTS